MLWKKLRVLHGLPREDATQKAKGPLYFIHVPKCGGKSIRKLIATDRSPGWITDHDRYVRIIPMNGHHIKPAGVPVFSVVRNPFDWLISMWHYNWPAGDRGIGTRDSWPTIEAFLYEFNSHTKNKEWTVWNKLNTFKYPVYAYRHLQTCQTFDPLDKPGEKKSRASFYLRLERIKEGIDQLGYDSNLLEVTNSTARKDYRYFYDTKLIDHINAHRGQELELLGYDFEGPIDDLTLFSIDQPYLWSPEEK
jgi:hypothetical protein